MRRRAAVWLRRSTVPVLAIAALMTAYGLGLNRPCPSETAHQEIIRLLRAQLDAQRLTIQTLTLQNEALQQLHAEVRKLRGVNQ